MGGFRCFALQSMRRRLKKTFRQWSWKSINDEVKDLCVEFSTGTPLLAYNTIHPLLQEIRGELTKDGRITGETP